MKKQTGFTLIELMVVVALAAILAAVAVPSYRAMIQNNRATTQANELVTSLNLGRSEAVRAGTPAVVCARPATPTTPETCSAGTDWSNGWLVFSDVNANGAYDEDGDGDGTPCELGEDCMLRVQDRPNGNPAITQTTGTGVAFQADGTATAAVVTVRFPDCTGNQFQTIDIQPAGRVSVTAGAC